MPKISVIVPIYGVEKFLIECVDSILDQTLQDIEIILIDDGSKDDCPQIIDEYAQKDERIIAIHKPNGGYGQTCNVGLERATGEYVAIVESDDYIDPRMFEDLYKIAAEYGSDIVKSSFYDNLQSKEEQRILKTKWADDKIPQDRSFTIKEYPYFLRYHPSIWSCIYKREFLEQNNIRFLEIPGAGWTDNLFQVQTMCLAQRINYTSEAYYYWRRLNFFGSDDLKDYTIPFKRCDEIHKWLDEENINDENILISLYKRELAYINIVLGMKKISDKNDCYSRIKDMCKRMNPNLILNNPQIKNAEKKIYKSAVKNLAKMRKKILFKNFRRNLISIRLNRHEKRIILFGKTILTGGEDETICKI